ncbi:MAG: hypothetical protein QOC81_1020 [Thermoanaerobaculia bacterium]|jgi:hypothetical protein|nr:hypothetical protein [Thermoanaerobaculia bacterium]
MSLSYVFRASFISLCLIALPTYGADCPKALDYPANGVEVTDTNPRFNLKNPAKGGTTAAICLLTEEDLRNGHQCSNRDAVTEAPLLTVGLCNAGTDDFGALPASAITGADAIIVLFRPLGPIVTTQYLRIEATDAQGTALDPVPVYKIVARAGVQDFAEDPRYKLWIYTGYTYLRTKADFRDGFPELLARYETRLYDEGIGIKTADPARYRLMTEPALHCSDCGRFPHFRILRLYGETGLTGTAVVNTNGQQPATTPVRQAFTGSVGAGWGWTLPIATDKRGATNAFSILAIARLGILTIPGLDADSTATPPIVATSGKTAYNWMLGYRIENESGGNFEGKYFELGLGESEQFSRKKVPRLRADLFVPFPGDNKLFRFATRMQFDTPTPFNKKENADPGGEIRISLVFNIDARELTKRLGGK